MIERDVGMTVLHDSQWAKDLEDMRSNHTEKQRYTNTYCKTNVSKREDMGWKALKTRNSEMMNK